MESCSPGGSSPVNSQTSNTNSTSNNTANNNANHSNNNNVANSSNSNVTNGTSTNSNSSVTPKLEHSPPEHYERQTVLMWGTASNNTNSSANRSPSTESTPNGLYATNDGNHMKHNNQIVMSPVGGAEHYTKRSTANSHLKWSESKEIPVTYQLHSHQDATGAASDTASMYAQVSHSPHLSHHSSSTGSAASAAHIVSPDQSGLHHSPQEQQHSSVLQQATSQHQTVGSSCEVWSPAYSQYQYFTYHHAPQHANTQWVSWNYFCYFILLFRFLFYFFFSSECFLFHS